MTLTQWDAIIFDMDGLLVDSETMWYIVEKALIESRGCTYADEVRQGMVGLPTYDFVMRLIEIYGFTETAEELAQELTDRMLNLGLNDIKAQPGADELVDYVIEHNIPRAVASGSPKAVIEAIMQAKNWQTVFAVRCSTESVKNGKPAPDVYLKAAELIGADPTRCLALEDSVPGARAATAAGMTCFAVPDVSHSDHTAFAGITPHVFNSLHEVLAHLQNGH